MYSGLYQVWTDESYVYAATSSGLEITDIDTEVLFAYINTSDGYTSVWSDEREVFIGTTTSGIKKIDKSSIVEGEIVTALTDYAIDENITHNNVTYVHGNSNKLVCCTAGGVDIYRRDIDYRVYTTISGVQKCFITKDYGYAYYTVSGMDSWSINRLNIGASNWETPDIIYTTGSGFLLDVSRINDFFVTEHTSLVDENNTLFVATDVGVFVYDEGEDRYARYY